MTTLPPIDWFRDPGLTAPTPVTIDPSGRIYGHIAAWNASHVGMPGKNVRPPRSRHDYSYYHVGAVQADDAGAPVDVSVGHLTLDTGHAPLTSDAGEAAQHYDHTGSVVADVCAGEDEHGIWFSGSIRNDVDDLRLHKLRASAVSGDWRVVDNGLELVAALMVNTPGFPIPRARVASAAELAPLVAANVVPNPHEEFELRIEDDGNGGLARLIERQKEKAMDTHKKGDLVELVASGAVAQVTEITDDGMAVELLVAPDEVRPADEQKALAASAARTQRQQLRSLAAQVEELRADRDARDRADAASSLLASLPE